MFYSMLLFSKSKGSYVFHYYQYPSSPPPPSSLPCVYLPSVPIQLKGFGMAVLPDIDPNPSNFVSAGIVSTTTVLVGCLVRLEPNTDIKVGVA